MADVGVLELCGIVAAISAGLGGPIAVIRWCSNAMDARVRESEKTQKISLDTYSHKLNNTAARVDQLERNREGDVQRIVTLEVSIKGLEKGQERIEHQLDKMEADSERGRAEIIDTIREISKRELKP